MASYKQACRQCGTLIPRDARFCPACSTMSPFGVHCPSCARTIQTGQRFCMDCGRPLYLPCPHCGGETFAQDSCEACGRSLMVPCGNRRCGEPMFFDLEKCPACGQLRQSRRDRRR